MDARCGLQSAPLRDTPLTFAAADRRVPATNSFSSVHTIAVPRPSQSTPLQKTWAERRISAATSATSNTSASSLPSLSRDANAKTPEVVIPPRTSVSAAISLLNRQMETNRAEESASRRIGSGIRRERRSVDGGTPLPAAPSWSPRSSASAAVRVTPPVEDGATPEKPRRHSCPAPHAMSESETSAVLGDASLPSVPSATKPTTATPNATGAAAASVGASEGRGVVRRRVSIRSSPQPDTPLLAGTCPSTPAPVAAAAGGELRPELLGARAVLPKLDGEPAAISPLHGASAGVYPATASSGTSTTTTTPVRRETRSPSALPPLSPHVLPSAAAPPAATSIAEEKKSAAGGEVIDVDVADKSAETDTADTNANTTAATETPQSPLPRAVKHTSRDSSPTVSVSASAATSHIPMSSSPRDPPLRLPATPQPTMRRSGITDSVIDCYLGGNETPERTRASALPQQQQPPHAFSLSLSISLARVAGAAGPGTPRAGAAAAPASLPAFSTNAVPRTPAAAAATAAESRTAASSMASPSLSYFAPFDRASPPPPPPPLQQKLPLTPRGPHRPNSSRGRSTFTSAAVAAGAPRPPSPPAAACRPTTTAAVSTSLARGQLRGREAGNAPTMSLASPALPPPLSPFARRQRSAPTAHDVSTSGVPDIMLGGNTTPRRSSAADALTQRAAQGNPQPSYSPVAASESPSFAMFYTAWSATSTDIAASARAGGAAVAPHSGRDSSRNGGEDAVQSAPNTESESDAESIASAPSGPHNAFSPAMERLLSNSATSAMDLPGMPAASSTPSVVVASECSAEVVNERAAKALPEKPAQTKAQPITTDALSLTAKTANKKEPRQQRRRLVRRVLVSRAPEDEPSQSDTAAAAAAVVPTIAVGGSPLRSARSESGKPRSTENHSVSCSVSLPLWLGDFAASPRSPTAKPLCTSTTLPTAEAGSAGHRSVSSTHSSVEVPSHDGCSFALSFLDDSMAPTSSRDGVKDAGGNRGNGDTDDTVEVEETFSIGSGFADHERSAMDPYNLSSMWSYSEINSASDDLDEEEDEEDNSDEKQLDELLRTAEGGGSVGSGDGGGGGAGAEGLLPEVGEAAVEADVQRPQRLLPISDFRTYYIPEGFLSGGKTSVTYKVRERRTRRHFAATFILQDTGKSGNSSSSNVQEPLSRDLQRICALTLMLHHPNLVQTYDVFYRQHEDAVAVQRIVQACAAAAGDSSQIWVPEVVQPETHVRSRRRVSLHLPGDLHAAGTMATTDTGVPSVEPQSCTQSQRSSASGATSLHSTESDAAGRRHARRGSADRSTPSATSHGSTGSRSSSGGNDGGATSGGLMRRIFPSFFNGGSRNGGGSNGDRTTPSSTTSSASRRHAGGKSKGRDGKAAIAEVTRRETADTATTNATDRSQAEKPAVATGAGTVAGFEWPAEAAAELAQREQRVAGLRASRADAYGNAVTERRARMDRLAGLLAGGHVAAVLISGLTKDEGGLVPVSRLAETQGTGGLTAPQLAAVTRGVADALNYLHSFGTPGLSIVHGAVQPHHVVLSANGVVKLVNYMAMQWRLAPNATTLPSEDVKLLRSALPGARVPTPAADMLGLGCTLSTLAFGAPAGHAYQLFLRNALPAPDPALLSLLDGLLKEDPAARMTAAAVLQHPFASGPEQPVIP